MGSRIHPMQGEPFCPACHAGDDTPCSAEHKAWWRHGFKGLIYAPDEAPLRGWAVFPADEPGLVTVQCSSKNGYFASTLTPEAALALSARIKAEAEKALREEEAANG